MAPQNTTRITEPANGSGNTSPTKLLTEMQLVAMTGLARGTVRNMRSERRGPQFVKLGTNGAVRYRESDVLNWIERQLVPTSD